MHPDRNREMAAQDRIVRQHVRQQILRMAAAGAAELVARHVGRLSIPSRLRGSEGAPQERGAGDARALFDPQCLDMLDALSLAAYATDAAGWITFYNEAAAALWGRRPILGRERWCGSWRIYRTDGTLLPHDHCPMAIALLENRAIRDMDAVVERPDGSRIRFMPYPTPLRDASDALMGAVNILVDLGPLRGRNIPDS